MEKDPIEAHPGRWKWMVLVASFLNMAIHVSIEYNCGVINEALLDRYDVDPVEVSWLVSYYCSLFAIASPLASAVILLTDCRLCVVLSGLMGLVGYASSSLVDSFYAFYLTFWFTGVAQSLSQSGSVLVLSYYFPDNLPLVQGVCLAGSGMGSFIHPVLTQAFIDTFGFKGSMLMLAGLAFQSTFLGLLFRPTSLEMKSKGVLSKHNESKWKIVRSKIIPPVDIFKIPAFVVLIPTVFFYSVAFQSMVVLLPSYIKRYVGLSIQEGSVAAMVFGAGSVASRLFSGFAASDENIGDALLFVGMSGLLSVLSFCGGFIMSLFHGVYIYSFFFGFYSGGMMNLTNSMVMNIVGIEQSAHAYGLTMFTYGIAGLVGPPAIAWLVEIQGPSMLFIMCGLISLMCAVLSILTTHLRKYSSDPITLQDLAASIRDMSIYVFGDDDNDNKMTNSILLWKNNNNIPVDDEEIIKSKISFTMEGNGKGGDLEEEPIDTSSNGDAHQRLLSEEPIDTSNGDAHQRLLSEEPIDSSNGDAHQRLLSEEPIDTSNGDAHQRLLSEESN